MTLPKLQTPLTVIVQSDLGAAQADADLSAIEKGDLIVREATDMYFHQLRLRVALDDSLASKVTVYWKDPDGKLQGPIDLKASDLRWPPGFQSAGWHIELLIIGIERQRFDNPDIRAIRDKYARRDEMAEKFTHE